jgi:anti-anti-sigma regulatory factor
MPACNLEREVDGSTAFFRICGKFDGACAWALAECLEREALAEVTLDFSQVDHFVDYGIAVLASAILSLPGKRVRLQDLRQHQERLFRYFGVDPSEAQSSHPPLPVSGDPLATPAAKEVA